MEPPRGAVDHSGPVERPDIRLPDKFGTDVPFSLPMEADPLPEPPVDLRQQRPADIAPEVDGISRRLQQPRDNARRRGFAVRAGDAVDRRGAELEEQLDLGGDPHPSPACRFKRRQRGLHSRGAQDQVRLQVIEVPLPELQHGAGLFQTVGRRPDGCPVPLVTGQRILDTLFPIAKGGTAAVPGGFGTGKTMTQHQIAKWSDADIIIYIGCGERGNEMTQVLEDFSKLIDPKSGNLMMDRTTLIANTSNMPVAAREASIYTGVTLAEYYRDMGYDVAIMADSTSRWAEALRELSGRLEEMPAEEGFPAYLASKLSAFYERAGMMQNLNGTEGSVSIIGAVSPQGGDFSEPVTQNTKRFVRCFWGLDKSLAYARHFPAIHWLTSYSEYLEDLTPWYREHVSPKFVADRNQLMAILNQESSLMEIVKLIGSDVLPDDQKLTLEIARVIRLGFLQQNAFHAEDTCVPMEKQFKMMETILYLYEKCRALINRGMPVSVLKEGNNIFEKIISIKYDVANNQLDKFDQYKQDIDTFYDNIMEKNG